MATIAATCSSGVLFRGKQESGSNGAYSLAQYNDLRPVENIQIVPARTKPIGFTSTSAPKSGAIRAVASPTVSAPKRETYPKKGVVITGMVLVSVFGSYVDTFYNKLLDAESGISLIDRFDASTYSVRFVGEIRDFSSEGYDADQKALDYLVDLDAAKFPEAITFDPGKLRNAQHIKSC